jgi:hypothetical protein
MSDRTVGEAGSRVAENGGAPSAMNTKPENYIVDIHPDGAPEQGGLGVIADGRILTCAHHRVSLGHGRRWTDLYRARRIHDGEVGTFAAWLATSMDFMVLDDQPIGFEIEDSELFAGAVDVVDCEETLRPARLEFSDPDRGARVAGFFFGPDGRTRHDVELSLWDDYHLIEFRSNGAVAGTSGGPLFLEDGSLVGLVLAQWRDGSPKPMSQGVRIDLAAPLLLHQVLEFERKVL